MKAEKELVDLNSKANEVLYRASKQKTKVDTSGERITFLSFELFQKCLGHIESYKRPREGKAEMKEEYNKGFEDSRQLAKGKELHQP
ncbi:ion channel POLLUX-like 2 [Pyrus ussuriensis x Pyrus communis]|uniref:Ion channel POLLUX-like 2 n=1 Tax=Pyrus ussuriensis x Pyrus communis TaxID=2448454 RepID=A0A5N5FQ14_9ROSA|nr:ion channel POLLUX-like 2 [Pyrus ussuriensis x Pyrus communis]